MKNNSYETLSQATKDLNERGYKNEFEVTADVKLKLDGTTYSPKQLSIVEVHRFEGMTNPSDLSVVYALETDDEQKGIIIDSYGPDASTDVAKAIKKIEVEYK